MCDISFEKGSDKYIGYIDNFLGIYSICWNQHKIFFMSMSRVLKPKWSIGVVWTDGQIKKPRINEKKLEAEHFVVFQKQQETNILDNCSSVFL